MGKLKKIGIAFFSIMILLIAFSEITDYFESESTGIEKFKAKSHEEMNDSELSLIAVQYDYRDLQRNIDNYKGKIIFVQGTISNVQPQFDMITLCNESKGNSCDEMFIQTNGNYLTDDKISGYVEVIRLAETAPSTVLGTTMPTEWLPGSVDVSLTCSNC
jgi:hypothetical protein|tara:strand:- start:7 stop:486 length:480 start_codon:yes stop_codon:yes gene_type:complete